MLEKPEHIKEYCFTEVDVDRACKQTETNMT